MVKLLSFFLLFARLALAGNPDLRVLGAVSGIDGKTVGNTVLFTTENGTERCHPLLLVVEATAATAITVGATVSVGTNSPTFDNILAATAMSLVLLGNTTQVALTNGTLPTSIPPNTVVTARVSAAAIGTSQTLRVTLLGYYQ